MNPVGEPADLAVRARALAPAESFLVQAPAGSGKTELLIQRFLRLLAVVEQPEEILAITFTRKAAAEMRERILAALDRARDGAMPAEPHLLQGFELARAVNTRDEALGWGLADQPGRLRIGTIDSVNTWLSSRAPISGGQSALHRVTERPEELYREAARQTLGLAAEEGSDAKAVCTLLEHCDNRAEVAVALLTRMLARRDQWLRHTGVGEIGATERRTLEAAIRALIEGTLQQAESRLPWELRPVLADLLLFAGANLAAAGSDSPMTAWGEGPGWPLPSCAGLEQWRGLAKCLVTGRGEWRRPRGINVNLGFPKAARSRKAQLADLLEQLAADPGLAELLHEVQQLPDAHYSDAQWQILKAVVRALPLAAAMLQQVFDERGETDFTQVATHALGTLASGDAIGELSLVLDYALRHILLDEYQDTSRSQFELLCRLTAGWEPGDGRTLFLVGDPMQSIYRFREAEVGIFLATRTQGVGQLPLEFLPLETNFRSDPRIVDWVNGVFGRILPAKEDPITGAVPLAPSVAFHAPGPASAVQWHLLADNDHDGEARRVVDIVRESLERWPADTLAILVRSRRHAARIGPLLRAAGIGYSAPDLELLGDEPVIQDLLALTRALVHAADRIAWLAVLRAPWCGLTLADLHALVGDTPDAGVWSLLNCSDTIARLSADGQRRAVRLRLELGPWLTRRGACPLRELVTGAWLRLGGPACLVDPGDLDLAEEFFAYLDEVDEGGDCPDVATLLDGIAQRPVIHAAAHDLRVQLMTMHKAKGLEFDTVVLPGLGLRTRGDDKPLLLWDEISDADGKAQLVLAPRPGRGALDDPLYDALWRMERQRTAYEQQRLLYVATTRARRRLHLFAGLAPPAKGEAFRPAPGSLLYVLWTAVASQFDDAASTPAVGPDRAGGPQWLDVPLRRLPAGWESPLGVARADWTDAAAAGAGDEDWAGHDWRRQAGTVAHRWLQEIARQGVGAFDTGRIAALEPTIRRQLRHHGTPAEQLEAAGRRVRDALLGALGDEAGRWLLSASHAETASEFGICVTDARGEMRELRLDRTFVDDDGYRWVVDFKISAPAGDQPESVFIEEAGRRHAAQLAAYRDAIRQLDRVARPVRAALYFPLLPRLVEVTLEPGGASE